MTRRRPLLRRFPEIFSTMKTFSERKHRCDGKTIVITGANVGIGFETAKEMLVRGGKVIILCQNEEKMLKAKEALQKSVSGLGFIDTA